MTTSTTNDREKRRRRRERWIILFILLLIGALSLFEAYLYRRESPLPVSSNILIFGLINVNIILILFLLFLIIRNIVKLVFERRGGVLGSKLQNKLVAAFVGLSLIPTAILFLVAINFLSYSIDNWFNLKVGETLEKTLEIAQLYYQQTAERAQFYAQEISKDITRNRLYVEGRKEYLRTLVEQRQKTYRLGLLTIFLDNRREVVTLKDPLHPELSLKALSPKTLEEVYGGKVSFTVQPTDKGDLICGLSPIFSYLLPKEVIGVVAVSFYLPKSAVDKIEAIQHSTEQYKQIFMLKNPIKLSYFIILFIVTLLIIFFATWFGIYLARGITVPIRSLAEGTQYIAEGNLQFRINVSTDDEIGILVNSFNQMTQALERSNRELKRAYLDLEARRKYMETVLRNVSAGIISLDREGRISTVNRAAQMMFDIKLEKVLGRRYDEVLLPEHLALAEEFLKELRSNPHRTLSKQLEFTTSGKVLTILMNLTAITDEEGKELGIVAVFEDLTELQKAVRQATWREAARRMAHEIKNPLTPIQLSAQRLRKRFGEKLDEGREIFEECTKTIINQVEVLKNLVDAFSRYARMPALNPALYNLNEIIGETVALYQEAHREITFAFHPQEGLPLMNIDGEQIKRVMVNLLDNAVAAVEGKKGKIEITVSYDAQRERARVEVIDNGCGIPAGYKIKIFEPYFSTKKTGTGLGLAIVSAIVSDHNGHVSVRDNPTGGTIVAFELTSLNKKEGANA